MRVQMINPDKIFISLFGLSLLWSSNVLADWYKSEQAIMGTEVVVDIWHENADIARQCSDAVFKEMRRIDALMSPYRETSELSRVNREAAQQAVTISDELFELIERSLAMSVRSSGAFDITFASVGHLYDYREQRKPSAQMIKQKLPAINYRHLHLDRSRHSISFAHEAVKIDLGGIAKGYAVDNAIALLKQCGIDNGLVSAGGDSRILGDRHGKPWMMGVRHPRKQGGIAVSLPLNNTAVSTSGDYERYFVEDGQRYHHIIQPQTGHSAADVISVTVLGDEALSTDALSTTVFVLGVQQGLALIETMVEMEAIIIDAQGKMHYTSGLMPPQSRISQIQQSQGGQH